MQIGFRFDQGSCIGCQACVVSCKVYHRIPPGPTRWRRLIKTYEGSFPEPTVTYFSTACFHCERPACVSACPVGAISKRASDGVVVVDRETCLGKNNCDMCLQSCPFEAPQFGPEPNAKMQMCDLCWDRITAGAKPVCVESCPLGCLEAGPLEILREQSDGDDLAHTLPSASKLGPSILFQDSQQKVRR